MSFLLGFGLLRCHLNHDYERERVSTLFCFGSQFQVCFRFFFEYCSWNRDDLNCGMLKIMREP